MLNVECMLSPPNAIYFEDSLHFPVLPYTPLHIHTLPSTSLCFPVISYNANAILPYTTNTFLQCPVLPFTLLHCPAPESMEEVKCVQQPWARGVQVQGGQAGAVQGDMGQLLSCTTLYSV